MSRIHQAMLRLAESRGGFVAPSPDDTPPESPWELPLEASLPSTAAAVVPAGEALPPPASPVVLPTPAPPARTFDDGGQVHIRGPFAALAVTAPGADPAFVDGFRKLAGSLHHLQLGQEVRAVTVASSLAGEGKTLTAINLALTLSLSYRRRVLLIDADLRAPSIHTWLDLPARPGLTDLLAAPDLEGWPIVDVCRGLSVLTAGTRTRDPISRLSSEQMRRVLMEARTRFDWVIIDLSPVGPLPDATLVTALSDASLLVVGAGSAPSRVVRHTIDAIGEDKIIGVVLNRASEAAMTDAYGGSGYGAEVEEDAQFW